MRKVWAKVMGKDEERMRKGKDEERLRKV